jgi:predicted phosphodiesterase
MKILFTADLHLNIPVRSPRTGRTAFDVFAGQVELENPEVVVVAGDLGTPTQAAGHLVAIRNVVGDRMLVISLGNHDFWLDSTGHSQFSNLGQVVTRYWREPARDIGAVLLDLENADLGDLAIVGGYGHFDLGLAEPDLHVDGQRITEDIYLSGGMKGLFWNDFRCIPNCGTRVRAEAIEQAKGIAKRMDQAISGGKRLLVAVHTCPWRELNGHPLRGNEQDILSAYSGNSQVGKAIEKRNKHIDLLVCGHTHMPAREQVLHGIWSLNVGADYGRFRGVVYDTAARSIRWIGEPF